LSRAVLSAEMSSAVDLLERRPSALTIVGGDGLVENDPALRFARSVLARTSGLARAGRALVGAQLAQSAEVELEALLLDDDVDPMPRERIAGTFTERIAHKEALLRGAHAFLALPSGPLGIEEVFSALCLMQTGKLPRRPLVLVDTKFWTPILDAVRAQLVGDGRALIRPADLALATITDDVNEAVRLVR
jgi:hypothetical protein